jgi:hypothetical protein
VKSLGEINATLPEGFEIVVVSDTLGRSYDASVWYGLQYEGSWVTRPQSQHGYPLNGWRARRLARIARRMNGGVK